MPAMPIIARRPLFSSLVCLLAYAPMREIERESESQRVRQSDSQRARERDSQSSSAHVPRSVSHTQAAGKKDAARSTQHADGGRSARHVSRAQFLELLGALGAQTEWVEAEVAGLKIGADRPQLVGAAGLLEGEDREDLDGGNRHDE